LHIFLLIFDKYNCFCFTADKYIISTGEIIKISSKIEIKNVGLKTNLNINYRMVSNYIILF